MNKVGHTILTPGSIIRSPSGNKDWVVVERSTVENPTIKIACIHKYMQKSEKELMDWFKK